MGFKEGFWDFAGIDLHFAQKGLMIAYEDCPYSIAEKDFEVRIIVSSACTNNLPLSLYIIYRQQSDMNGFWSERNQRYGSKDRGFILCRVKVHITLLNPSFISVRCR